MPWNYDDEEINGIVDANIKDSPPNPPAVNTAATVRVLLKSYWAAIRGQVAAAVTYVELTISTARTAINTQLATTLQTVETRTAAAEAKANSVYLSFSLAKFQGKWNPATNVPALTAIPAANGDWYEVSASGTSSITGTSENYTAGDRLLGSTTAWFRIAAALIPADASVSFSKLSPDIQNAVGSQEQYAMVNGKQALYIAKDSNGDVVFSIFDDDTSNIDTGISIAISNGLTLQKTGRNFVLKYGTVEGQVPFGSGNVENESEIFVNGKKALFVVKDTNGDVIFVIYDDNTSNLVPSGFAETQSELVAARGLKPNLNSRVSGLISTRAIPTTPIWGAEKLRRWPAWARLQDTRFDWILIGDSYTQGNYFSGLLRSWVLADGPYLNGNSGWCGFMRWSNTIVGSINQSVYNGMRVTYTLADWTPSSINSFGVDGYITGTVANSVVTLTCTEATNNVTLVFEKHAGAGDFRYRLGAGAWTTVSTANATQDIGDVVIDTSGAGANFTIEIEPLAIGIILCGAIARNAGNVLNFHKCGISGGTSTLFGVNDLWTKSVGLISPEGAIIMFGTNEHGANMQPETYRSAVQNIITKLRSVDPLMDIILAVPTFTKMETEEPRTYSLNDYAAVLFELAQSNHTAFVNHSASIGAFSQSLVDTGLMNVDRVHPGTKGGYVIANNFFKLLKR